MADAHLQGVQKLYEQYEQAGTEGLCADPDVVDASRAVESARRALNLDRHNPDRQQAVRDAEKTYLVVTNSFYRNARLARIEAEKETKRVKAAAQEAEAEERRAQLETMTPEKAGLLKKYATLL